MLPHLGYDEQSAGELACQAAEKIRLALAEPYVINGKGFVCTCSMGVALYPGTAETVDHLIKQADTAMYEAKGRGGNAFNVYRQ